MYKRQLVMVGVLSVVLTQPAFAEAIEQIPQRTKDKSGSIIAKIPRLHEIERPATNIKDWLSQSSTPSVQSPVEVTGVRVNRSDTGIEVILETKEGEKLKPITRNDQNILIIDIINSKLALPNAKEFRSDNPVAGITAVTVTQVDSSIRVTVTGEAGVPKIELFDSDEGLIFGLTLVVSTAQQPPTPQLPTEEKPTQENQPEKPPANTDEPIELVVTGERDDGYNPPQTSVGTRTNTPLRDIPSTIQVVPKQVIEDRNVTQLRDVLDNVSGVALSGGDYGGAGFGIGDYSIRGFRGQTTVNGGLSGAGDFSNVEQVEVLRGPAAVLFGSGDPGGVINIMTKQPLSEPFYEFSLNGGSYNNYRGTADLSGPLNSDRSLRYRLNIALQDSDSFRDFVSTKKLFIAPTIAWDISDDTKLTVNFEYSNEKSAFDAGIPALSDGSLVLPINRYFGYPSANDINTFTVRGGYTFEHQFNKNLQVRNSFSFSSQQIDLIDSEYGDLIDDKFITRTYVDDKPVYEDYATQTDLLANFKTGAISHQLLFGFDAKRSTQSFFARIADLPPLNIFNPNYNIQLPTNAPLLSNSRYITDSYGIHLQDQIKLLDNLILVVAGQYDWVNNTSKDFLADTVNKDFGEAFSPRIGIVYQPIKPISLYTSYSSSFVPNSGRSRTGSAFKPERGTQYEVGIKGDFLDGKLSTVLAAYQITKSNVLTTDPVDPDFSIQVGEQRSRGIDFSVTGEILPGWNVIGGYSYIDAIITDDNVYKVGSVLRLTAPHSANLWTTYRIQSGDLKGLGFGLGAYFVSDRPGDQYDVSNYKLPAYTRFDAALFYRRDNWEAAINVENLFDVEYYANSRNSTANYPGAPFTLIGSLKVRF